MKYWRRVKPSSGNLSYAVREIKERCLIEIIVSLYLEQTAVQIENKTSFGRFDTFFFLFNDTERVKTDAVIFHEHLLQVKQMFPI